MLPGRVYTPELVVKILKKRMWLVLVPLAVAAAGTAAWSRTLPDLYRSQATIQVVPQSISESLVRSTIEARIGDRLPSIREAILSRTRLESLIQEFDLYPGDRQAMVMEDVVNRMRYDIDINIVRSDAFGVAYIGADPVRVMQVTERLGSLFIEQSLSYRYNLTEVTDQFLDSQLLETREALVAQEQRLENYRKTYAGQLPTQVDANVQQISGANMQAQRASDAVNQAMTRRLLLEREIADLGRLAAADVPAALAAAGGAAVPRSGAAGDLAAARSKVAELEGRGLKPGHPDLDAALRNLRDAERVMAAVTAADRASGPTVLPEEAARQAHLHDLNAQIQELDRQIAEGRDSERRFTAAADAAQLRLDAMPTRETELVALMRDYDIINDKYRGLLQKREEARISANLERRQVGEQFNVIDPARLAERPFSPDRFRLNLAGAALGLLFGVAVVGLLEYREQGFRTDEDVTLVLGLPVLAVVPVMQSEADRKRGILRSVLINVGCGSVVAVSAAVWVYVYLSS